MLSAAAREAVKTMSGLQSASCKCHAPDFKDEKDARARRRSETLGEQALSFASTFVQHRNLHDAI